MKKSNNNDSPVSSKPIRRATTPDARENQLIALAIDLAERQLREGTASSQVISHFLKLGSSTQRLEKDILVEQKKLIKSKAESIESSKRSEELYSQALDAMRKYSGNGGQEDD